MGEGQYFTDIPPEAVVGESLKTTDPALLSPPTILDPYGKMTQGQLANKLWDSGGRARSRTDYFLQIDVSDLPIVTTDKANIYFHPSAGQPLVIRGRTVRSGKTLP